MLIRVQPRQTKGRSDQNAADQAVAQAIKNKLGPAYTVRSTSVVGPKVSQELFHDGVIATLLAILMIAIYVSVRFEWQYGIGAAIATGHDVLVTAGLFSVFQLDFGLTAVAALLTLAGYSINDTVVVFDRIRENRRKYKRMNLAGPDQSLHQSDGDANHPHIGGDGDFAVAAVDLRRAGAVRFLRARSCSASWWAPSRRSMSRLRFCCICPRLPARSKARQKRRAEATL